MQILPARAAVSNQKKIFLKSRRKLCEKCAFPAECALPFFYSRATVSEARCVKPVDGTAAGQVSNLPVL
jgi:hypothetical protein